MTLSMKCLIFKAGAYGQKLPLQWIITRPLIFFILHLIPSLLYLFLNPFFSLISLFFFFSISSDGWQHETQILTWVLSYDKIHSPEALSICSASAAMCISEVGAISYVFLVHHLIDNPEYMIFMWLCLEDSGTPTYVDTIWELRDILMTEEYCSRVWVYSLSSVACPAVRTRELSILFESYTPQSFYVPSRSRIWHSLTHTTQLNSTIWPRFRCQNQWLELKSDWWMAY